jgi:hypothetical protein
LRERERERKEEREKEGGEKKRENEERKKKDPLLDHLSLEQTKRPPFSLLPCLYFPKP